MGMWGIPEKNYQKLAQQCKLDHSNMLPAHEMTKCLFFQMLIFSNIYFNKLLIFPNFTLICFSHLPRFIQQKISHIAETENTKVIFIFF